MAIGVGLGRDASAQQAGRVPEAGQEAAAPGTAAARGEVESARPDRPRRRFGDGTFGFRRRTSEGEVYAYGQRYTDGQTAPGRFGDAYGAQPWPVRRPHSPFDESGPTDAGEPDAAQSTAVGGSEPGELAEPKPRRKPKVTSRSARPMPPGIARGIRLDAVPNEVLLELRPGVPTSALDAIGGRFRLTRIGAQRLDLLDTTVYRFVVPAGLAPGSILQALRNDTRVASAQLNGKFHLQTDAAGSQSSATQWSADRLNLKAAHDISTGRDVVIAMIDTGIDIAHPELAGGDIRLVDVLDTPFAAHETGTAIAGALVSHGRMIGVAPGARLLAIRAFDAAAAQPGAEGTSLHVAKSLDEGDREHAKVFSLGFVGPKDDLLGRIFSVLRKKGDIVIAAAGNAGSDSLPLYPAADENVIAVTATDSKDRVYGPASRGSFIRVAAPGVDMLEPAPGGAYKLTTGTSLAAAEVSGLVGLMLARRPDLDTAAVRKMLIDTADPIGTGSEPGVEGLVDPVRAVERLDPEPRPAAVSASVSGASPGENSPAEPRSP